MGDTENITDMVKVDIYQVDIVDTVSVHMDMDMVDMVTTIPDTAKIIPNMAMKIKSKSKKALTKKMIKDLVVKMTIAIQKGLDMVDMDTDMVDMDMMDTVMVETDMDTDTVDLIMVQVDMADTVTETTDMDKDTMNTTVDMADMATVIPDM